MSSSGSKVGQPRLWWAVLPIAAIGVLYLWPLAAILRRSLSPFAGRSGLSGQTVLDVLTDQRLGEIARFTLFQAALSTIVCVMLGTGIAAVWSQYDFAGRRVLGALAIVPFVMPTIVIGAAMVATERAFGIENSPPLVAIVAAHVVFNLGLVIRVVESAFRSVPASIDASAASLGVGRLARLRTVHLPIVMPAVVGVAGIVALLSATSFGVIVALGEGRFTTIEVEIWVQATRTLNLPVAAVLTVLQLVALLAALAIGRRMQRRNRPMPQFDAAPAAPRRRATGVRERLVVVGSVALVVAVCGTPLFLLATRSLRVGDSWQLTHYRGLGSALDGGSASIGAWTAIGNSALVALAAAAIAFLIAVPAVIVGQRHGRAGQLVEVLVGMPLATSAATLGMGFLVAFSGPLLDLRGRWILVPAIQAAVAVPFVVRVLAPQVAGRTTAVVEAAATCGVGPWRRQRELVWPATRHAVGVSAGLAFAVSLGEFGATSFVARNDNPTLPIMIGRLLARPGDASLGQAMAASCVLAAGTLVIVGGLAWWSDRPVLS